MIGFVLQWTVSAEVLLWVCFLEWCLQTTWISVPLCRANRCISWLELFRRYISCLQENIWAVFSLLDSRPLPRPTCTVGPASCRLRVNWGLFLKSSRLRISNGWAMEDFCRLFGSQSTLLSFCLRFSSPRGKSMQFLLSLSEFFRGTV